MQDPGCLLPGLRGPGPDFNIRCAVLQTADQGPEGDRDLQGPQGPANGPSLEAETVPSEASWNLGWAQAWLMRPCTNSFTSLGLSFHFYKMGINTAFLRMFFERIKQFFGGGCFGGFCFLGVVLRIIRI